MAGMISLAALIKRGGVYYNIGGSNPVAVLAEACRVIELPKNIDREGLHRAILEREALMPTAIGKGVAIPHPRNPIVTDESEERVAVFFLNSPISYNALDRKPVSVLFLILSAGAQSHLGILAEISHLVQRSDFLELLSARPSTEELASFIAGLEKSWEGRNEGAGAKS